MLWGTWTPHSDIIHIYRRHISIYVTRKEFKEVAWHSFKHAAHALTNRRVMRGTQVQTTSLLLEQTSDKTRQQETSDMSQLVHSNFRIF